MARFDVAPPRGIPDLTITLPIPPQTNATVRIRGGIYFSGPEIWLMESTNTTVDLKRIKWFTLSFELIGKDSQEGGTDAVRYSGTMTAKVPPIANPPFVGSQGGNVTMIKSRPVYDFSTQIPINVLNEDPVPGAKDEIYAKLSLYNVLTGEVIKIDSNVVEIQL